MNATDRAAYDAQLERMLTHLQDDHDSQVLEGGEELESLDPSMRFLVASGLMEVIGNNPGLVDRVLKDIDDGWRVSLDGTDLNPGTNGRYHTGRRPFVSKHANITFELDALLESYVNPSDRFELIGHEISHSLDAYRRTYTDGRPTYMEHSDRLILENVRHHFFTDFESSGVTNGLGNSAFKNWEEFWAEISENFLSGSIGAAVVHAASPQLYGVLSRFYDIQYPGLVAPPVASV